MVLLGPNGSGKTTLLMTLATVLKPTAGLAKVMGFDVVKYPTKVRQILGISFQDARGFWRHKPAEILQFHAAMVYSTSLLLIALVVLPAAAVGNTLILLPFLFFLAMGLAGISATLAAMASTHGEYFFAYQQVVQMLLLTLSTVYYPMNIVKNYFPAFLTSIVSANPLSLAAEAMRQYTFLGYPVQPFFLLNILLASLPFTIIGAVAYLVALRTIQTKGKM
jgi:hypothetical protein